MITENSIISPIISQWELYVAMTTIIPIQSAQKPFPLPDDAYTKFDLN